MFKYIVQMFACLLFIQTASSQNADSLLIRKFFNEALSNGKCYNNLDYLCSKIGARLSGSPQASKAVLWAEKTMKEYSFDTVYLQEVKVPHWVRGGKEQAEIRYSKSPAQAVAVCALGGSVATDPKGINTGVVEVKTFKELETLGKNAITGKIVFFNRPMDPTFINTFNAYGAAVDQRSDGAVEAARYGAVGVIVRSMTLTKDDHPHTGAMHPYQDSIKKIPAIAISTIGADLLSQALKNDPSLTFYFKANCQTLPDTISYNVIGEIKGTEHPEEIVVVGGHLDSWDTGKGAHDDGAGCVQSIEVLRLFKTIGVKPKRTIRAVMFMNEENGLRGGKQYAELAKKNKEKHIVAVETDAGGFSPKGFSVDANAGKLKKLQDWLPLFAPYGLNKFYKGHGGADISPLADSSTVLMELDPDSQRYFDYHHAATDVLENVNKRELEMGAGTLAALVYLISEYGL